MVVRHKMLVVSHIVCAGEPSKYDLIANVCHEGRSRDEGVYKVHMHRKVEDVWY